MCIAPILSIETEIYKNKSKNFSYPDICVFIYIKYVLIYIVIFFFLYALRCLTQLKFY